MLQRLKRALYKTTTVVVLMLSIVFMQGCSSKETIITAPIDKPRFDFTPLVVETPYIDFNRSAKTEQEAALMLWDLYSYIKELESSLKAVRSLNE